jgi:hypothetical protein
VKLVRRRTVQTIDANGAWVTGTVERSLWPNILSVVRIEDAVIFAWLAVVQPLTIGNHTRAIDELGKQGMLWGIAYLIAAGAAVVCLASRSPDEPTLAWTTASSPHSYAPLPFVIGVATLAGFGIEDVGVASADVAFVPALCLSLAAFFLYSHLPTLPAPARRVSVLPMVIVSSALFNGIMFEVFSQLDRSTFVEAGAGLFVFLILLSGIFYALFVFSPAQIADARGSWTDWVIR